MKTPTVSANASGQFTLGGDLKINRLGFGAMRLTGDGIWGPPKDKPEAIRVLKRSIDLGINFIDTADSYGPHVSENLIAEALYPYPKELVIATKGGLLRTGPNHWPIDASPKHLKEALEGSLKRLKVERIDLYQLHRFDSNVPMEETLGFLKDAQTKGLIKHIGLSEVSATEIKEAQKLVTVVSVQNMYNLGNRQWEQTLKFCEEQNIGFIPWYPLAAGNVNQHALQKVAIKHKATVFQIALAWLLHHSAMMLPIPGTSSLKHLEENVAAATIQLDENDMNLLGR